MLIYIDQSRDFWPSGWMVYACLALGALDVSLLALVASQLVRHL